MKPRLESARLTQEDWFARGWLYASRPSRPWRGRLHDIGFEQDRRDAELMLRLVQGGCSLCLGDIAHTVECVGWRCAVMVENRHRHLDIT